MKIVSLLVDDGLSSLADAMPAAPRRGQRSLRHTPNIETLVVVDKTMVDFHGEKNVKDYVLTVMNMVSFPTKYLSSFMLTF